MPKTGVEGRAEANPEGRAAAVVATKGYADGTVGAVVHKAVKTLEPAVREVAAGTIGKHYKEPFTKKILALPATDANLKAMAVGETAYWNNDAPKGAPSIVGSSMSAATRLGTLVATRDGDFIAGAKARCDMNSGDRAGGK